MFNPAAGLPPDPAAEIAQERQALAQRGATLGAQKDQLLLLGGPTPPGLIVNLFTHIKDTIQHDIHRRALLTIQQRRANLGNIVISTHLLLSIMDLDAYDNRTQGYEGRNIWRMLRFLTKFDLPIHLPGIAQPIYQISDADVITILENDIQNHLPNIIDAEINAIQPPPPPPAGIFQPVDYIGPRTAIRTNYRDHTLLNNLTLVLTKVKELEQLNKAIVAINHIMGCAAFLNNPNPNIVAMVKKDILYCLVVIGETATKKNLTPQTANLLHPIFSGDGIRKLLINLANKITHSEWDIQRRNIEQYLANTNFQNILNEMPQLLHIFTELRTRLSVIIQNNTQVAHYQVVVPGGGANPLPPGNALTILHNGLTGSGQTYMPDRAAHAPDFTSRTMATCIGDEGNDIAQIQAYIGKNRIPEEAGFNAIRFHLSRIAKFLEIIEDNNDIQIDTLLGGNLLTEYRQFRNYIRHGNDLMEIIDPVANNALLIQYANLVRTHVHPAIEARFLQPIV